MAGFCFVSTSPCISSSKYSSQQFQSRSCRTRALVAQKKSLRSLGVNKFLGSSAASFSHASKISSTFSFFAPFRLNIIAEDGANEQDVEKPPTSFWDTRAGVFAIGFIVLGFGLGSYYGLQSIFGLDELQAGNITQILVAGLIMGGWALTYVGRWGSNSMTYNEQRKRYEDALMLKKYETMTDEEYTKMVQEMEEQEKKNKARREARRKNPFAL